MTNILWTATLPKRLSVQGIRLKPLEMPANGSMKETLKNPQANSILR
nr:MAG TPA: hypothetical protein [Caudoviricetes sp.]